MTQFGTMLYDNGEGVTWCAWDRRGMVAGAAEDGETAEHQLRSCLRVILHLRRTMAR